jgi:hypothetical protein
MSTKIYDAYKVKVMNDFEKKEFIDALRKHCKKEWKTRIVKLVSNKLIETTIQNYIAKKIGKPYEMPCDTIESLFVDSLPATRVARYVRDGNDVSNKSNDTMNAMHVNSFLEMWITSRIDDARSDRTIATIEYDFTDKIVFFPLTRRKTLIMVFGQTLQNVLYQLTSGDITNDEKDFIEKFEVEDYHYQNQTDPPENVPTRLYNKRERDWDKAMPSGVPNRDGFVVFFSWDDDFLLSRSLYRPQLIRKHRNDAEEIIYDFEKYIEAHMDEYISQIAKEVCVAWYRKKNPNESAFEIIWNFNKQIKDEKTEEYKKYQELKEQIRKELDKIDTSIDALLESNVTDWL